LLLPCRSAAQSSVRSLSLQQVLQLVQQSRLWRRNSHRNLLIRLNVLTQHLLWYRLLEPKLNVEWLLNVPNA
jgi:hypothetical protein